MKTKLHTYSYDTKDESDRESWAKLEAALLNTKGRGHKMHSCKLKSDPEPASGEITLEPEYLFENQWNSNVGRVFDWYQEAVFSSNGHMRENIKRGHYLDITPEIITIREETLQCCYTGQQFKASDFDEGGFNISDKALASPYLKESDLYLCRLLRICDRHKVKLEPLTESERAYLLPLYVKAQTRVKVERLAKQLAEIHASYEEETSTALMERDGKLWLLDHGVEIDNVIFYSHSKRFAFGWREPLTGAVREAMQSALQGFPYPYEFNEKKL